jgi:4,5:9,10-diseco-3-hydroxy-5,9,17-trioxoandrosta-1(10),2-diene-4-oate hydrolase
MTANPAASLYHEYAKGLVLHYTLHEPSEPAGTVIFIHGSGPGASGWSNFKQNVQAFQLAGYRCVVYDQWGYGATSKPTDVDHTLHFFVDGLVSLMDGLGIERATLIGNSLGGAVALGAALDHASRVDKLILMAPGGIESKEDYFAMPGIQEMVKYPMGSPEFTREVLANLLTLLVYDNAAVDEVLIEERWSTLQTQNAHVLISMAIPDLTSRLGEVEQPILVFWGTDDHFCPASGAWKLLDRCPSVQAEILNQCGHWVMAEHPPLFNQRCLDFLAAEGP